MTTLVAVSVIVVVVEFVTAFYEFDAFRIVLVEFQVVALELDLNLEFVSLIISYKKYLLSLPLGITSTFFNGKPNIL